MAAAKKDTPFVKVTVENRDPENETMSTFVGGNMIIIDGKPEIKHYKVQLGEDKVVEIPEPFAEQLKNRSMVVKKKDGTVGKVPMYIVTRVGE